MASVEDRTGLFLRGLPFFSDLSETDLAIFTKAARIRDHKRQEPLFLRGDKAERFFIILSGWVKLHRETPEGGESIVALLTKGDIFGETAILNEANYPFSASAIEDTRIAEIPAAVLKDQALANPDIMKRVMATMSREMHQLQMETEHLVLMSAPQRVGCLLLLLSANMVGSGGTLTLPFDKALAAQRLGMKPETFSRVLAQLKPVGITVQGAEIQIDSFKRLAEFTCTHCSSVDEECKGARMLSCSESACAGACAGKKQKTAG